METSSTTENEQEVHTANERINLQVGESKLTCIEYPGVVENERNALETLGGIQCITKSLAVEKKRLELRFRPRDVYCKPAHGNIQKAAGLLMRVRRRKKCPGTNASELTASSSYLSNNDTPEDDGYEYKVDILGTISTVVKFEGMCEFQYLPVEKKVDGTYVNLQRNLVMTKLTSRAEYMSRDAPLFLPPILFSRFDFPQQYGSLTDKPDDANQKQPLNSMRKTRTLDTTVVSFTDPCPAQPNTESLAQAEKIKVAGLKETMERLFEERPIWPRSALRYRLRHCPDSCLQLKKLMSSMAYIFLSGPWRSFWVRFGYDPRKDPAAKRFQGIDFRRRQRGCGEALKIQAKRTYQQRPAGSRKTNSEFDISQLREDNQPPDDKEPKLRDFEFHPDILPPHRQVTYMVCDIFDAEIQELASRNDGQETTCSERDGWCIANFTESCRKIISSHVDKLCPDIATPLYLVKKTKRRQRKKRKVQRQESDDDDANNSSDAVGLEESLM